MSALDNQVGGNHYKDQPIQPIQLAYMVGGTPAFCKVVKYCTRQKNDHRENILKAIHCIELEKELTGFVAAHYEDYKLQHKHMIDMATDNEHFRAAWRNMRAFNYGPAIEALKRYLQEAK